MKVYVITWGHAYDMQDALAVYTTRERANERAEQFMKESGDGIWAYVDEFELEE